MFYQVLVDRADRDAFIFLWFTDGDLSQQRVPYRMNIHIFGCTSSPSVAAFALRKTASDNEAEVPAEAVSIVNNDFYVDDICTSVSNVEDAKTILAQVSKLLKCGGFHLTKILSNNKQVLEFVLPDNHASSVVDLDNRELPIHKTLEVFWDADQDCFRVKVKVQKPPCTRRGLLSMINQTYDPLGVIQPYLLPARKFL